MNPRYAPCGIDCQNCSVYIATQNNDPEERKRLAEQLFNQHNKEVDPETIVCDGCWNNQRLIGFCSICQIRACAFEKGYATCAECELLPCEKGQFIWQKNSQSLATLNELKGSN